MLYKMYVPPTPHADPAWRHHGRSPRGRVDGADGALGYILYTCVNVYVDVKHTYMYRWMCILIYADVCVCINTYMSGLLIATHGMHTTTQTGAGKTTLLDVLAGRKTVGVVRGHVRTFGCCC